ncbi:hypothetical protein UlMin_034430 [Ulmus minor]
MASERELEAQLAQSGERLLDPPPSVEELLPLLDRVESCLSKVEQSPSRTMQNALSTSVRALVSDQLLRHTDIDVKVAVASCISEITRITAPEAPYEDEQMKEVFNIIVSSFENLSDNASRSYPKRTSILETVAKVRSCVVMLDLECDYLILEMFQHFLQSIRDYHPDNVFSSMVTIMTLVLEESEDIPTDLLSLVFHSLKNGNEEVLPAARRLCEKVLSSCSDKIKRALAQAVKSLGLTVDDYSRVVASICNDPSGDNAVQNEVLRTPDVHKEDKRIATEADRSPKSAVSNGFQQPVEEERLADSDLPVDNPNSKNPDSSSNAEPDDVNTEKEAEIEPKAERTTRRSRKSSSSVSSHGENEKEDNKLLDEEGRSGDVPPSPSGSPVEAALPIDNDKDESVVEKLSVPKALEDESANIAPASPSVNIPSDDATKNVADGTSDSEVKPNRRTGKKVQAATSNENKASSLVDGSVKETATTSDSEAKPLKRSAKKGVKNEDGSSVKPIEDKKKGGKNEDGSSVKQMEDKKKRVRGKALAEKDVKETITSPKSSGKSTKDVSHSEATPKTSLKRKRTPSKGKESGVKEYGENLVGSKIKVWWPDDKEFYDGVVDSFDDLKKKHRVLYNDGDEEILNLKRERWEFIEDDSRSQEEEQSDRSNTDASAENPLKKVKTSSDKSTKQRKVDASTKKSSSSKSRVAASKSGRRSRNAGKTDDENDKDDSKSLADEIGGKSKDHTPRSGRSKSANVAAKASGKSKNSDSETPKTSKSKDETSTQTIKPKKEDQKAGKSKVATPKSASVSKGKSSGSSGKSNVNGAGKAKSSSSKIKESEEDAKESSSDSEPVPEGSKGKSPKVQESEVKIAGKKRQRGVKG